MASRACLEAHLEVGLNRVDDTCLNLKMDAKKLHRWLFVNKHSLRHLALHKYGLKHYAVSGGCVQMTLLQPLWAENQPYSTELESGAFEMSLGKISQNNSTQSTDKDSGG